MHLGKRGAYAPGRRFTGALHQLLLLLPFCCLWAGVGGAQTRGGGEEALKSAILEQIAPYALQINDRFYSTFRISSSQPPMPGGGFAEPLMPQGAPIVREGVIEVTPYADWSFAMSPDGAGGASHGIVSRRLYSYRVFQSGRGWSAQNLLMLHYWQWNARLSEAGPQVALKMDQTSFRSESWPQELVASIYNVAPSGVAVSRPDPNFIAQILGAAATPRRGGCRPCETEQPDGSCRQWRAC